MNSKTNGERESGMQNGAVSQKQFHNASPVRTATSNLTRSSTRAHPPPTSPSPAPLSNATL
jgi:hypothetical protein